ncbi:MAG: hypothetical protein ACXVA9_01585, partial [Bdellovibrionales bacterium]
MAKNLILFLSLLFAFPAQGAKQPAWMKSISDLGEPIETVEFQALRVELGNHLYRLMAQMVTLYNERDQKKEIAFFVNDLYLVSAPQVNAAVILGGKSQITKGVLQTRIVLTTGLFRFLRETLTRDGVLNRDGVMKALIGILAHEIAHVFELESTDSLLKRYRRTGSQANEALADQDAIMILREAGYPPECLYVAMQLIVQYQEEERKKEGETDGEKPSTWKVATDTHPQDELRLSLQRLGLTFGRVLF